MNNHFIITYIVIASSIALTACGQTKTAATTASDKGGKRTKNEQSNTPVILQATTQDTYAGREESGITTEQLFVIVWRSNEEPTGMFLKSEDDWQPLNINKINNYRPLLINDNEEVPFEINYERDFEDKTYANDTLELWPTTGGKNPMPNEIPMNAKNVIYYQTASNHAWQTLQVDSIISLPPVVMP